MNDFIERWQSIPLEDRLYTLMYLPSYLAEVTEVERLYKLLTDFQFLELKAELGLQKKPRQDPDNARVQYPLQQNELPQVPDKASRAEKNFETRVPAGQETAPASQETVLTTNYTGIYLLQDDFERAENALQMISSVQSSPQYDAQLATLEAFSQAIRREAHVLSEQPHLLWQQLYNRLQWDGSLDPQSLVEELGHRMMPGTTPWIRQLTPVDTGDQALLRVLAGHTHWVESVAFSPDGKLVLTGSRDNTARLWETGSGKQVGILKGHSVAVNRVAFSPDGKLVLTAGSGDWTARLWETGSGKQVGILKGHSAWDWVSSVAFSPDGRLAITCDQHGRVFFWQVSDAERGKLVGLFVSTYEVGALHWQDATHVVLADLGGSHFRPHFYYLQLEATW